MTIVNFTPQPALLGGLLIGLAAALLMLGVGRVFGITGILTGILNPKKGETLWRILVVLGLLGGAITANLILGAPQKVQTLSYPYLIIGGVLIGFGTRLGGGCTSGHGVCGISRLSARSIVATLTFMATGFITVFLLNI